MATLSELLAGNRKLRMMDFADKVCRLTRTVHVNDGWVFPAGTLVTVGRGHTGRWNIRGLERKSNGCLPYCRGISGSVLELVGDVPPPSYVPPPRPEVFPCKNCETPIGRDLAFRGCCNVACWCQAHPDAADRIVRAHFRRTKD
jgi:hypothetical protein